MKTAMRNHFFIGWAFLVGILCVGRFLAQAQEAENGPTQAALQKAKQALENMGMTLGEKIGRVGKTEENSWAYSATITNSQKALEKGFFKLADPRPTPVKEGTEISLVIELDGKVVLFVNSRSKYLDRYNSVIAATIARDKVDPGVEVRSASFPAIEK